MRPKAVVTSLPVKDVEASLRFYRDGLDLETPGVEEGIVTLEIANLSLFLIDEREYLKFTSRAGLTAHYPETATQCILSCAFSSKREVDELLANVEAYGGTVAAAAVQETWGYIGYFRDPDGHLWEVVGTES